MREDKLGGRRLEQMPYQNVNMGPPTIVNHSITKRKRANRTNMDHRYQRPENHERQMDLRSNLFRGLDKIGYIAFYIVLTSIALQFSPVFGESSTLSGSSSSILSPVPGSLLPTSTGKFALK